MLYLCVVFVCWPRSQQNHPVAFSTSAIPHAPEAPTPRALQLDAKKNVKLQLNISYAATRTACPNGGNNSTRTTLRAAPGTPRPKKPEGKPVKTNRVPPAGLSKPHKIKFKPSPKVFQPSPKVFQPSPKFFQPSPKDFQPSPKNFQPSPKDFQLSPKNFQPSPKVFQPSPKV